MDLKYKFEEIDRSKSFYLRREHRPYLEGNWHCHDEFEIMYVLKGEGIRIIGDNLSNFSPPQLALVGSFVPHLWKNIEISPDNQEVDIVVIKFNRIIGGQDIFSIPEFQEISELLKKSYRGLLFGKITIKKLHALLIEISTTEGPDKIIKLLQILKLLSEAQDVENIASSGYIPPQYATGDNRLNKIINYISNNFTQQINLIDLANIVAMTPSSLCRYFKNKTNKTIFQFINEFRIGKACQMLICGDQSIIEICYNSGFNSLTSFNRDFREYKKVTPRKYKENYRTLHNK
jgi:AraC-like DNA-binding protein